MTAYARAELIEVMCEAHYDTWNNECPECDKGPYREDMGKVLDALIKAGAVRP